MLFFLRNIKYLHSSSNKKQFLARLGLSFRPVVFAHFSFEYSYFDDFISYSDPLLYSRSSVVSYPSTSWIYHLSFSLSSAPSSLACCLYWLTAELVSWFFPKPKKAKIHKSSQLLLLSTFRSKNFWSSLIYTKQRKALLAAKQYNSRQQIVHHAFAPSFWSLFRFCFPKHLPDSLHISIKAWFHEEVTYIHHIQIYLCYWFRVPRSLLGMLTNLFSHVGNVLTVILLFKTKLLSDRFSTGVILLFKTKLWFGWLDG